MKASRPRLDPAIFEQAAAALLNGEADCCCHGVMFAMQGPLWSNFTDSDPHIIALRDCFAPWPGEHQPVYYWEKGSWEERREQRALALLLMAAIVRSERTKKGGVK